MDNSLIGEYFVEEEVCDQIVKYFHENKEYHYDGKVLNVDGDVVYNDSIKVSTDLIIEPNELESIFPYSDCISAFADMYLTEYYYKFMNGISRYGFVEPTNIQYYPPNGGFKLWHCERSGRAKTVNRFLTFMTYLTTTPDAGTEFYYQNKKYECVKGSTLIWPAEFTHMHRGVVNPTKEKMIITGWLSFY